MMKKLLLATLALGLSQVSYSQVFKVTTTNCPVGFETQCEQLKQEIQKEIDKQSPSAPVDKYASGMAKANKISAKGGTTDYANIFDVALISAQANIGAQADLSDTDNLENTASGLSIAPALLVGVNLDLLPIERVGTIEMRDLDVFFSFMSYDKDKLMDQDGIKLDGEMTHFGMQIRYHWIKEHDIAPGYMLQWTGVQLHTGYQFTHNKLSAKYILDPDDIDPISSGGLTANVDSGSADVLIEHTSHTIPLELSTGLRFLYAFTLYGGLGTDFTLTSESNADINADIDINATGGAAYDVDGKQSGEGTADFFNARAFAGFQFNIPFVRVFAQAHKYFGDDTYAVNAGLKILY